MTRSLRFLKPSSSFFNSDKPFFKALQRKVRTHRSNQISVGSSDPLHSEHLHQAIQLADAEFRWLRQHVKSTSGNLEPLSRVQRRSLLDMTRRLTRLDEPIAYILGSQPFGPLEIQCRPPTLIPRTDTEEWTLRLCKILAEALKKEENNLREKAKRVGGTGSSAGSSSTKSSRNTSGSRLTENERIEIRFLDLCSGTGCISLLIAHELSKLRLDHLKITVVGADFSSKAIELSKQNQEQLNLSNEVLSPQVSLDYVLSDLFSEKDVRNLSSTSRSTKHSSSTANHTPHDFKQESKGFDLIISNPPYIPESQYQALDKSVKDWEDRSALLGSHDPTSRSRDGLDFYRRISQLTPNQDGNGIQLLKSQISKEANPSKTEREKRNCPALPRLVLEVGEGQAKEVAGLFERGEYEKSEFLLDEKFTSEIWKDSQGIERVVVVW